jgi:O-antigen/teichoic acid export membrane protein
MLVTIPEAPLRKFSTNIVYSFLGEILLFGFSFLLGILTARYLGPAGRGSFWIIYNAAGLLTIIFSMRFRQSMTYHLSKNRDMLGEIALYGLFVGIVAVSCVAILATCFSNILYSTLLKGLETSWAILLLVCFSYYLWALIIAVIEGLMLFNAKAIFMGSSYSLKCLLVLFALGYLKLKFDDLILLMGSVETIVYSLVFVIVLGKAKHFHINVSSFRGMLKYSAGSFPGTVSDFYTLRIDAFFLNYFSGPSEVGIYSVAVSLASMLLYMPAAIRNVLLPHIASVSDKAITAKLSRLLVMVVSMVSMIIVPLVWAAVIPIYGKEFSFSRPLFLILIPGSLFWGVFLLLASDIEGRGHPWRISMVSTITVVATAVSGLILIPIWNSVGAAIVSSITQGISMILAVRLYKRMIGVNSAQLLIPTVEDLHSFLRVINHLILNIRKTFSPSPIFRAKRPAI